MIRITVFTWTIFHYLKASDVTLNEASGKGDQSLEDNASLITT